MRAIRTWICMPSVAARQGCTRKAPDSFVNQKSNIKENKRKCM